MVVDTQVWNTQRHSESIQVGGVCKRTRLCWIIFINPAKTIRQTMGKRWFPFCIYLIARSCRALKARDLCFKSTVAQWMLNKRVLTFISFFCGPVLVKKACYGAYAKPASFSIALKLDGCLDSTTVESLSKWYDHFNTQPCSLWVLRDLSTRHLIRWSLVSYQQVNFGHFLGHVFERL